MFSYVPKLHHAMITILFCMLLIALGAKAQGRVLFALNFGAFVFAIMTAIILYMMILKSWDEHWETLADFAKVYGTLDEEARAALGFQFPEMRYRMKRGEVRGLFENTNVPIELFRLFLQTSNEKSISPRRDWYTKEKPEWAWLEIEEWLEGQGYVAADSAAGPNSWLWIGNARQHLMAYWMAGRELRYKDADRVFAYDMPTPPLVKDGEEV